MNHVTVGKDSKGQGVKISPFISLVLLTFGAAVGSMYVFMVLFYFVLFFHFSPEFEAP